MQKKTLSQRLDALILELKKLEKEVKEFKEEIKDSKEINTIEQSLQ